jgi:4-amino-4-deoxy-L-arabinose transferase-like glycosyltransferase
MYFSDMKIPDWRWVLAICILFKLGLHLYLNTTWSLHRDELLYLSLGRRLAWGYASVPPNIGFWAWVAESLLGGSIGAVRLIPTVFGTATVVLTALMAREFLPSGLSGKYTMLIIGIAGLTCGGYLRLSMLFMPVVFDVFFWTLLCWLFLKYINTEDLRWLTGFGIATGFGLLNKYSVLIFLFAMLPGLLFTPHRRIFKDRRFYLASGLALLVFLPNIIWQIEHDLPVFQHMFELAETQFVHVTWMSFFSDQMLFFLPAVPVWIYGLYVLLFRSEMSQWRIYGWMYVTVLLVLLAFSAKSYYALGAYPVLIAAGAACIEWITQKRSRWVRYAIPAFMLITGLMTFPALLPVFQPEKEARFMSHLTKVPGLQGILRWEDGNHYALPQDFADMLGWEELGRRAGELWQGLPDKANSAIYAESYGQAGAVEYFGKPYEVPPVISFSESFRYWLPDRLSPDFQTLIYINDELGDDMPDFFEHIEKIWELDMPISRQHGDQIYLCFGPTPAFFERIGAAIQSMKAGQ